MWCILKGFKNELKQSAIKGYSIIVKQLFNSSADCGIKRNNWKRAQEIYSGGIV